WEPSLRVMSKIFTCFAPLDFIQTSSFFSASLRVPQLRNGCKTSREIGRIPRETFCKNPASRGVSCLFSRKSQVLHLHPAPRLPVPQRIYHNSAQFRTPAFN